MPIPRSIRARFAALLVTAFAPAIVMGQVAGASISGTIAGQAGEAMAGARITISRISNGVSRTAVSAEDGSYLAANLTPGAYRIGVAAPGYVALTAELTLSTGLRLIADFQLTRSSVREGVEVRGGSHGTELAVSAPGGIVAGETMRQLPLNGRDWTQLAGLEPGVAPVMSMVSPSLRGIYGSGQQLAISGARPQGNNYRLNGISINDAANGAPGSVLGVNLGVDALGEFNVVSNSASAEYGRVFGGVIDAITRSGTKDFHGSAYEYLRNGAMDARNFFDGAKPALKRNQFGATAGGPVGGSRTFWFGAYEGLRQNLGRTQVGAVPSLAAREGRLAAGTVAVSPLIAPFLQFYPRPTGPLLGNGDTGQYSFAGHTVTNEDFFTARGDRYFGAKDSVSGIFMMDQSRTTQPDEFNNKLSSFYTRQRMASVEWTRVVNARMVNAFRFGYSRHVNVQGLGMEAVNPLAADHAFGVSPERDAPQIEVSGLTRFTGGRHGLNDYRLHWNSFQAYNDLSLNRGRHFLKAGAALERMQDNVYMAPLFNGRYTFGSLAGFLSNQPLTFVGLGGTPPTRDLRQTLGAGYLQDDFRWKPNFALNLGLRYETVSLPSETHGRIATLRSPWDAATRAGALHETNPTRLNFEPRIGFAWDPFRTGKTAIRSGFGIYDVLPLPYIYEVLLANSAPYSPFGALTSLPSGAFPTLGFTMLSQDPKSYRGAYLEARPKRSYLMQWNFTVEQEVAGHTILKAAYAGSRGIRQPFRMDDMDGVLPVKTAVGYLWPDAATSARINPNFGRISGLMWQADSYYHAVQTQARRKLRRGVEAQASFTWSKAIDTQSVAIAGDALTNSVLNPPWYDTRLNRGLSDFDVRRMLVASLLWDTPRAGAWGRGAGSVLSGWHVGAMLRVSDGVPFTPLVGGDPLGQKSVEPTAPPDRLAGPGCATAVNPGNPDGYIKLGCFGFPNPANLRGNAGRNILIGPGLNNLDLSVSRTFLFGPASEGLRMTLRGEVFNALNRANFALPSGQLFNQKGAVVGSAGVITATATPSRQAQVSLRLSW
jgi:hypothetical protein